MELLNQFINFLLLISAKLGYWGIIFLMTIESSFIPFPSEVVIPPAAYLSAQGEMNIYLVVICGIIGSMLGALINYFIAFSLGRKAIYSFSKHKLMHMLMINEAKIKKAEEYFLQYGKISTFIGRLVPAIRQLISLPAGFSKMKLSDFVFYTFLGSSSWIIILSLLGYFLGSKEELLSSLYGNIKHVFIVLFLVFSVFIIFKIRKSKSKQDIKKDV